MARISVKENETKHHEKTDLVVDGDWGWDSIGIGIKTATSTALVTCNRVVKRRETTLLAPLVSFAAEEGVGQQNNL